MEPQLTRKEVDVVLAEQELQGQLARVYYNLVLRQRTYRAHLDYIKKIHGMIRDMEGRVEALTPFHASSWSWRLDGSPRGDTT
ncbi:hypothetical protein conserved [Leishmania donovani]|uniref:Uncharacterized protein n=4 Tax=Leishmania donovani species complex TaxID=38574 RepID=A4I2X8_LEIIN|nr:hypothetical protein, unknown function [Leishmania infantum JPCM5]XP_003862051.1 hypothetical protein, unknown function [Leishmania donovani]CAC9500487.1 hypothetical_protein_-_conserved [Leishmania infantum]AYU80101.1 hypothetical protein LdCL_270027300 [Leishmania donovani]CAJ1990089.1 hypothetical protein conserved [Leishmania donovani]CAM69130.1 hypothetical protein, unknown function [Leishmania infantum JPCM5]CBZ35357.1 hypothetical protein, unknown function [Leishmania donovani]|eukprot:XP_001466411.1 hypothetical protein, unknown function [Leishmania infantum JPCM5]